jgi:hypothetical protein
MHMRGGAPHRRTRPLGQRTFRSRPACGVFALGFYLHQQRIDTPPRGNALSLLMGGFAKFERAVIVERVRSDLARALAVASV